MDLERVTADLGRRLETHWTEQLRQNDGSSKITFSVSAAFLGLMASGVEYGDGMQRYIDFTACEGNAEPGYEFPATFDPAEWEEKFPGRADCRSAQLLHARAWKQRLFPASSATYAIA